MEAQSIRAQPKLPMHAFDDREGGSPLRHRNCLAAYIEVANHLDHERASGAIAVEAGRRCWCSIEITTDPNDAVWADSHMLSDVTPAIDLGVVTPHSFDGSPPTVIFLAGVPCVMKVNLSHFAHPCKLIYQSFELRRVHSSKRAHTNLLGSSWAANQLT
jgi:hypothetical protein